MVLSKFFISKYSLISSFVTPAFVTFSKKNKQLFSEIIQLTLSKTLFYDFYPVEEKGFQLRLDGEFYYYLYPEKINGVYCTTVTLISKIIENLQIDNNGIINCVF